MPGCLVAKAKVAGSNPVFRSNKGPDLTRLFASVGAVAFERFERVSPLSVHIFCARHRFASLSN
jgi:hypothetical protein